MFVSVLWMVNIWARVGCVSGTCLFVSFRVSFVFGFISGSRLEFVDSSSFLFIWIYKTYRFENLQFDYRTHIFFEISL